MPPTTPGTTAPGLQSSIVRPRVPSVRSRYAICGCAMALSTCWANVISTLRTSAFASRSVADVPLKRLIVRPSSFLIRSGTSEAMTSISGGVAPIASPSVNDRLSVTACSTSVTLRPRCVARVRA